MKVPKMKNPPPPPENSMVQVNANYEKWKDAREVDKAFDQFVKDRIIWWDGLTPNRSKAVVKDMKAFAKFYAQRCGIEVGNECVHCHKIKLIENGVCNCCGGEQ